MIDSEDSMLAYDGAKGGDFENINVNQGTFTDITAEGGTFNNITATGGLLVQDGEVALCQIGSSGIHLVEAGGAIADIGIIEDGSHTGVNIPDDLYIQDVLRVFGDFNAEADAKFYKNVIIKGILTVKDGNGDNVNLQTFVDDRIKAMVKPESLK